MKKKPAPVQKEKPNIQHEEQAQGTPYAQRLRSVGIPENPMVAEFKPVGQFRLAMLAATLVKSGDGAVSPSEVAGRALQIWNASGRALFVEQQASVLVTGVFCLDRKDWVKHADALVASWNDHHGAVPGHNSSEEAQKSRASAQQKAGRAVSQLWNLGPPTDEAAKQLFRGKAGTKLSREKDLVGLLSFAKQSVEHSPDLGLLAGDGDFLKASMLDAWSPLGTWDEAYLSEALTLARAFIDNPDDDRSNYIMAACPIVARWLVVMRFNQLAAAKTRT